MSDPQFQINTNFSANVAITKGPVYLLTLSDESAPYFIATKLDEQISSIKTVGFYPTKIAKKDAKENIIKGYAEMVSSISPEQIIEISFPWHQVNSVQSLVYRHKGVINK